MYYVYVDTHVHVHTKILSISMYSREVIEKPLHNLLKEQILNLKNCLKEKGTGIIVCRKSI